MYRYEVLGVDSRGRFTITTAIYCEELIQNARIGDIIIFNIGGEKKRFIIKKEPIYVAPPHDDWR